MEFDKASAQATLVFESRNVGNSLDLVKSIQYQSAKLWDVYNSIDGEPEAKRLVATAKTHLEIAAMLATKAVSRMHPKP